MDEIVSWLDGAAEPSTPEAAHVLNQLADAALSQEGRDALTALAESIEEVQHDHS